MLVSVQKTSKCPGPWYNGLQLCDHINGSYPVEDGHGDPGSLAEWQALVKELRPMRLMWCAARKSGAILSAILSASILSPPILLRWTNPAYWSVQGPVWAQAAADKTSDVGKWFSWGNWTPSEGCGEVPDCYGAPVRVPGVGCAQGSFRSESQTAGVQSALASFGSKEYASGRVWDRAPRTRSQQQPTARSSRDRYADYMVEAYAETWTKGLGIDGYTEDISANYGCMLQTGGKGGLPFWHDIIARVRQRQPQVVQSGEWCAAQFGAIFGAQFSDAVSRTTGTRRGRR